MSKKNTPTVINTIGKRKRATAHATLRPGAGIVRVNKVRIEHAGTAMTRMKMMEPVLLAGDVSKLDIDVRVEGGGAIGQADAVRLAIARALVEHDKKLEKTMLDYDRTLLVADVRFKEVAKPNRHGNARSKTQKSYR
jgi:small subunit ribosomal protein S9